MTQKQPRCSALAAKLDIQTAGPPKAELPACDDAALALEQEEKNWPVNRHPVYLMELMHALDHHRPKRQQAFDEVKRLLNCGQAKTEAFAEAWADLDWHNQACLAVIIRYGADLDKS